MELVINFNRRAHQLHDVSKRTRKSTHMIKIIHNDITSATGWILHGVNCKGVMGAGVALSIRNRWPQVYEEYLLKCKEENPPDLLGTCLPVLVNRDTKTWVINCFTQFGWGRNARASYDAIEQCLSKSVQLFNEGDDVNFPQIGCGHGKLDWNVVQEIINSTIPNIYNKQLWIK